MNAWESRLFFRAFRLAALIATLALLVTAATDEGGLSLAVRIGRTVPAVPFCSALGVFIALMSARSRGEPRALAAAGRSPHRMALPAAVGGVLVTLMAAIPVATPGAIDLAGFFPAAVAVRQFHDEGGLFVDEENGISVADDGSIVAVRREKAQKREPGDAERAFVAAFALVLGGSGLALISARRGVGDAKVPLGDVSVVALYLVASIVMFHAVAAEWGSAVLAAVPSVIFLAWSVWRFRTTSWLFGEPTSMEG